MGLVNTICSYQCPYRTNGGYCGRTAGCFRDVGNTVTITKPIPKKTIRITNDGDLYSLFIGNDMVLRCSSLKVITDEINRYEEEHLL